MPTNNREAAIENGPHPSAMFNNSSQTRTSLPGDIREQTLSRKRYAKSQDIKILCCWFFGLHGYVFLVLCCGFLLGNLYSFELILGLTTLTAWIGSLIVALCQGLIALWNASFLPWWMIALGVFPWMIIAAESLVALAFLLA